MRYLILVLTLLGFVACNSKNDAPLNLPALISDGMVLQQNTEVVLWGKTGANSEVDAYSSWGERQTVKASETGEWQLNMKTPEAGGPFEIGFQTKDTSILVKDVLVGEVWICSGQSNMEMPMMGWPPNDLILNSEAEISAANYPEIRLFTVPRKLSITEIKDLEADWLVCSPENVASFSATAYFFGKKLHTALNVPVGLIHSSWGGTPAESWTTQKYLSTLPQYKDVIDSLPKTAEEMNELLEWIEKLASEPIPEDQEDYWPKLKLEDSLYFSSETDDSEWSGIPVPGNWEASKLPNFDGIVWFRKKFDAEESILNQHFTLNLGPIDDMDIVYVNGVKVGQTLELGKWQEVRKYKIPQGLLKSSGNVIAVCVIDNTGGGGITGPEDVTITTDLGKRINLSGEWQYMPVAEVFENKLYFYSDTITYYDRPSLNLPISPWTPSILYNAMIHPLVPYTIKGAIWYQGESNVGRGIEYRTLFPKMIASWREAWDQGEFPFYFVQIAPYSYQEDEASPAAEIREAQLLSMSVPNTGMVVTTDIGNVNNIHPGDKEAVGERLARWALANDYGMDSIIVSGPLYESYEVKEDKIIVSFDYAEGGLKTDGSPLTNFEIAGENQQYVPANAVIEEDKVVVSSPSVKKPVAVRFGWSAIAEPNLFNEEGLPASPFRTDDWKRLSE